MSLALFGLGKIHSVEGRYEEADCDKKASVACDGKKPLEARLTPDQIKAAKASAQSQSFDQIVEKVAHLATG